MMMMNDDDDLLVPGIYVIYRGVNWFKNAKRTHVACGPVSYTGAITGLASVIG